MKKLLLILLSTSTIYAGGLFSMGTKNVSFSIGTDNSLGNDYTVIGGNVNYFIIDNLSIGASYQGFLGDDPTMNQMTVPVTYHIPLERTTISPYLGAFYNRTFIDQPYKDYNIYGGRAGISLKTSPNSFMSLGWVQEFANSADNIEKRSYPEVSGSISF